MSAQLRLITGTTSGSRSAGLYKIQGYSGTGSAELLNTNTQTAVSTTYTSSYDQQVNTSITPDVTNAVWGTSMGVYVDHDNPLQFNAILLVGDKVEYSLIVKEFVDGD